MTLQGAITDKGWTYRYVSVLSDITEHTLFGITSGRLFPSMNTASKLVDALGCELEFVSPNGKWYTVRAYNDNS